MPSILITRPKEDAKTTADILKELPNNISAALLNEMTTEEKRDLIITLGLDVKG